MKFVGITQRVSIVPEYGERRDALDQRWHSFLSRCGLTPLLLPNHTQTALNLLRAYPVSGVVLTGGNDLASLGGDAPERDELEFKLLELAIQGRFPLIGVCRGMQVIQHRFGVDLENVEGHVTPCQEISADGASREVNSYHTWGARHTMPELVPWAVAKDGVIKAIEHRDAAISAIMWHPERTDPFAREDVELFRKIFGGELRGRSSSSIRSTGRVYWITGLSGSGKTTIGELFTKSLRKKGRPVAFLDGDTIRDVMGNDLGHTEADRRISAMRNSRLCRMLAGQGIDVVCCTISMFSECRQWNRNNIHNYKEIYLKVPMEVLRRRDPKKIYTRAEEGTLKNVYGVDLEWSEPTEPDMVIANDGTHKPKGVAERLLAEFA